MKNLLSFKHATFIIYTIIKNTSISEIQIMFSFITLLNILLNFIEQIKSPAGESIKLAHNFFDAFIITKYN